MSDGKPIETQSDAEGVEIKIGEESIHLTREGCRNFARLLLTHVDASERIAQREVHEGRA